MKKQSLVSLFWVGFKACGIINICNLPSSKVMCPFLAWLIHVKCLLMIISPGTAFFEHGLRNCQVCSMERDALIAKHCSFIVRLDPFIWTCAGIFGDERSCTATANMGDLTSMDVGYYGFVKNKNIMI